MSNGFGNGFYYDSTTRDPIMAENLKTITEQVNIIKVVGISVGVFSLLADILLCYVTLKNKKLLENKCNVILLHGTFVNALTLFAMSLIFGSLLNPMDNTSHCIITEARYTIATIYLKLLFLLTLFWYIQLHHPRRSIIFASRLNRVFGIFYGISLAFFLVNVFRCISSHANKLSRPVMGIVFISFIIFFIIISIMHFIEKRRLPNRNNIYETPKIIVNVFVLSFLPHVVVTVLILLFGYYSFPALLITIVLAIFNPVYNVFILYFYDMDYKVVLKNFVTFRGIRYNSDELNEGPIVPRNDRNYDINVI